MSEIFWQQAIASLPYYDYKNAPLLITNEAMYYMEFLIRSMTFLEKKFILYIA